MCTQEYAMFLAASIFSFSAAPSFPTAPPLPASPLSAAPLPAAEAHFAVTFPIGQTPLSAALRWRTAAAAAAAAQHLPQ